MNHIDFKQEYMDHPVYKRLMSPGPKRLLALDGGGVKGALTIGYLEKIEDLLRIRYDRDDYCLWQYYDLIGGTSTGAIIASLLAKGKSVKEVKELYLRLGLKIFGKKRKPWIPGKLRYALCADYDEGPLEEELGKEFENLILGSEELKTGLCIVARRADNYGTYGFNNHPGNQYYEDNKGIFIRDLVRASSAAPTYFKSKVLQVGDDEIGVFVDGGVSSANNPAVMLFMIATMEVHGYNWHMGPDELLITSVGTGSYRPKIQMHDKEKLINRSSVDWAPELPNMFMVDANSLNQTLLDFMAHPSLSRHINDRAQSPDKESTFSQGAFSYYRYNVRLSKNDLQSLDVYPTDTELDSLRKMDEGKNVDKLYEIGCKAADKQVSAGHFARVFDLTSEELICKPLVYEEVLKKFQPVLKDKGTKFKKIKNVYAWKAKGGETVASITDDLIETINKANPGDYIVENQTSDREKYVVRSKVFDKRYTKIKDLPDGSMECLPKGVVTAVHVTSDILRQLELDDHVMIEASWKERQYLRAGDYIVCNNEYEDIYRISHRMFYETYMEIKKPKK